MTPNWTKIYSNANIAKWGLPAFADMDRKAMEYRHPCMTWSEIELLKKDQEHLGWIICCDVLVLDRPAFFYNTAYIFARRIEVVKDAFVSIDHTETSKHELSLTYQEIFDAKTGEDRPLDVVLFTKDAAGEEQENVSQIRAGTSHSVTSQYVVENTAKPVNVDPAKLAIDFLGSQEQLSLSLTTGFQIACLISTEHRSEAIKQLLWMANLTAKHDPSLKLSSDAHGLYQTLSAMDALAQFSCHILTIRFSGNLRPRTWDC